MRIDLHFDEEVLRYALREPAGSCRFQVAYSAIAREGYEAERRSPGAVRLAWLHAAWVPLLAIWGEPQWAWASALFALIWWLQFRLARCKLLVLRCDVGELRLLADSSLGWIREQIEQRRADQLRRQFDFWPEDETCEQSRRRLHWLHREGALSRTQLEQRLLAVEQMDRDPDEALQPPPGTRLH